MTDLDLFFDSSRDVAVATNYSKNIGVFYRPIYFVMLPFQNGLEYRNSDSKRLDRMNFSTLCTILVTFGPETSWFTLLTIAPFAAIWQKAEYHAIYLRMSWTYLDLIYIFCRRICGDDYPNIYLVFTQGTLPWQSVKFGRCLQMTPEMTFSRCSGIREHDWPIVNSL